MHDTPRPHDLLWGMTPAQLPADAPDWARQVLAAGQPVVVRRAVVADEQIAVGLRGATREQRFAAWMRRESVVSRVGPEQLIARLPDSHLPALRALHRLHPLLDSLGLAWGVTGSVGYQLGSGIAVVSAESDLDLLLRTPTAFSRSEARELQQLLDRVPCRVDLQLETPSGAIALREWAGDSARVLLKCATGARLIEDPWDQAERAA
ncbi:phosphoribosyl-dephospho-CoA transferase [Stutzerimonas nosocomialis]|uniref:Phosphoribosyl-dephospho-CoA transferase n=1 Tax=Stutzerimonas nosocomialis TaxID=1056496 RepID=A0A5R9Q9Z7_9GAMM|nr:malonate decarboxylase holo-ACP synthase [Stutzerimonas nosocomialis]TLX60950.1 phosphoribosyl-dephospho-CoA transferase [Stutzerimonas nosocomialis]TLX61946.1 phosphoribosyl-dephospho-CoA transferase [Stutzerimonas nosocomialis]